MAGIQGKIEAPVLQGDPGSPDYDAGAETHVVALDVGNHVAVPVGGAEVDRAGTPRGEGGVDPGGLPDLPGAQGPVARGEQVPGKYAHAPGIRDMGLAVRKGQLHGLPGAVVILRRGLPGRRKLLQDVQGHQGHDALAVRGDLADLVSPVRDGDGIDPLGLVSFQVRLAEETAELFGVPYDAVRKVAPVEGFGIRGSQGPQGAGVVREAHDSARGRGTPFGGEDPEPLGELGSPAFPGIQVEGPFPGSRKDGARGIAPLGIFRRGLQGLPQGKAAETAHQGSPGLGDPGHQDGKPSQGRYPAFRRIPGQHRFNGNSGRGPARGVESVQATVLLDPDQGEGVPADPVGRRLGDGQGRRGRHGGVHGVPTGPEGLETRGGGLGGGGGDHPPIRVDRVPQGRVGTAGRIEVHAASSGPTDPLS